MDEASKVEEVSPKTNKKGIIWTHAGELILCGMWEDNIKELRRKKYGNIMKDFADNLQKHGIAVTAKDVNTKLNNLIAKYKKKRVQIAGGRAAPSDWPLYQRIHNMLGDKYSSYDGAISEGGYCDESAKLDLKQNSDVKEKITTVVEESPSDTSERVTIPVNSISANSSSSATFVKPITADSAFSKASTSSAIPVLVDNALAFPIRPDSASSEASSSSAIPVLAHSALSKEPSQKRAELDKVQIPQALEKTTNSFMQEQRMRNEIHKTEWLEIEKRRSALLERYLSISEKLQNSMLEILHQKKSNESHEE